MALETFFNILEDVIEAGLAKAAAKEARLLAREAADRLLEKGGYETMANLTKPKPQYIPLREYIQYQYGPSCIMLNPPENATIEEMQPAIIPGLGPEGREHLAMAGYTVEAHEEIPRAFKACMIEGSMQQLKIKTAKMERWEEDWEEIERDWVATDKKWERDVRAINEKIEANENKKKAEKKAEREEEKRQLLFLREERERQKGIVQEAKKWTKIMEWVGIGLAASFGTLMMITMVALVYCACRKRHRRRRRNRASQRLQWWEAHNRTTTPTETEGEEEALEIV
jgi:hypothetical protein